MKIYRHLADGSRFHYYVEQDDAVTLWHPEITWESKAVEGPQGRLLAEGTVTQVLFATCELLPPDLFQQMKASLVEPADDVASVGHRQRVSLIGRAQVEAVMSVVLGDDAPVGDTGYRIVGTAAALLHGVCLPAGDIDVLLRERAGVDAFCTALTAHTCLSPPTYLEHSKQYFASFSVHGVAVELSIVEGGAESDTSECTGPGPWRHYSLVTCGRRQIPVDGPRAPSTH